MRLLYFDLTQGNRIGSQFIIKKLGWLKGGRLIAALKWREAFDNPFKIINKQFRPTNNQKLSQRQMAPLVILYKLLQEEGFSQEDALEFCHDLSREVAVAFLKFNIPEIRRDKIAGKSQSQKQNLLDKFADRFFNAESERTIGENDELKVDINICHFASYARELGVPELGPVFCASDQYYFDNFQPEVDFERTQTLAIDSKPCDFRFKWKEKE